MQGLTTGLQNLADDPTNAQVVNLFDLYKKEMRYLRNFEERTLRGYQEVFNRWIKIVGAMPNESNLSQFVIGMREAELNVTTCNISIRTFNAFLTWLKENGHCPQTFRNGKPFKLAKLAEEKKQLRVFSDEELAKILSFKPKGKNEQRIYALIATLADTGIRINEALNLEAGRVDFDSLLITVTKGKGKKERIVPISLELRKILHRYIFHWRDSKFESKFLFCTSTGTALTYRNAYRDFEHLLDKVKVSKDSIDHCFHSFRRKFARNWIQQGGNLPYLKTAMGHSALSVTMLYVGEATPEDLLMTHRKTSLVDRLK